jgi:hypothetical protein
VNGRIWHGSQRSTPKTNRLDFARLREFVEEIPVLCYALLILHGHARVGGTGHLAGHAKTERTRDVTHFKDLAFSGTKFALRRRTAMSA